MNSDATGARGASFCGRKSSRRWQNGKVSSSVLGGVVFLFAVLAVALFGSALVGREGQASSEGVSIEDQSRLNENLARDVSSVAESAFKGRLPEQAEPEEEALGYLRLLEYLPAQPPAIGAVSSPFGVRRPPHRGSRYGAQVYDRDGYWRGVLEGAEVRRKEFHSGVDIAVPPGTAVRAPGPGVVIATGRSPRLGTYVRLLHEPVQLETVLAHLSRVEDSLKRGRAVQRGEVVGFSGSSGRSTGPHLHFEIRSLPGRLPVDPTEVYELYFTCLDHLSRFPIGSVHAHLEPYRIWASVGEGERGQ